MAERKELNDKQKLFCKYYVSEEFFGNGVKAYCKAYGFDHTNIKEYNSAKVLASELLTNINIISYVNKELDDAGLNDNFVDKQLLFAIMQNADINSKVKAISEYNKLRQRIISKAENKDDITIKVKYEGNTDSTEQTT